MLRVAPLLVLATGWISLATGCISKAKEALEPAPDTVGTMTCREVVEQCDSQCGDPFCVNKCTNEGNQEAQGQHAALLDCGQRHGCTDQACMEQSCPNEIAACMGPVNAVPAEAPAAPAESGAAPGQTPPS